MNNQVNIGKQLQEAREQRGENLLDVEYATRIPYRLLDNLEKNDYSDFPHPTYAKRFLSLYSHYLHIDASHWLGTFETNNPLADIREFKYLHLDDPDLAGKDVPAKQVENELQAPSSTLAHSIGSVICIAIIGTGLYFYNHFETRFAGIEAKAAQSQIKEKQDQNLLATQETVTPPIDNIVIIPSTSSLSDPPKAKALTPEELATLGVQE